MNTLHSKKESLIDVVLKIWYIRLEKLIEENISLNQN